MSETTESVAPVGSPAPGPETGAQPAVLALAALGAVIVLGLLWFFVLRPLLADGAEPETDPIAATAEEPPGGELAPGTPPQVNDGTEEAAAELPLVTYEVFLSRDPFDPVVPEPDPVTDPGTPGTDPGGDPTDPTDPGSTPGSPIDPTAPGTPPGSPSDPTGPTDPGTPNDPGSPPADGCTTGDQVTCDGRLVSLIGVENDDGETTAVIQVDTTIYEVSAGETFAGQFLLRTIDGDCVTILYGDDAFRLCEGDRTLK